ncbi:MAG TPA: hypothetical protein PKB02_02380 [Anaerohalosphaeraceae bacterium]|nr:hypothetical protein [Anaerohalosphaeraceae bacterium]
MAITLTDLRSAISYYLGYGLTYNASHQAQIDGIIASGLRQFYYPPGLGNNAPYSWSFLRPSAVTLSVQPDFETTPETRDGLYDLPSDFGGIDGPMTFPKGSGYSEVKLVDERIIQNLYAQSDATGYPQYAAILHVISNGVAAQAKRIRFWPCPDTSVTLNYMKIIDPPMLTEEYPHPLGGQAHAETILASCLAVAEKRENAGADGSKWQDFLDRLQSSIDIDSKLNGKEFFGYNNDDSDIKYGGTVQRRHDPSLMATYSPEV